MCENVANVGGALFIESYVPALIANCTMVRNAAAVGGGIAVLDGSVGLTSTIIADSPSGEAIALMGPVTVRLSCCDLFGNDGGDWVGGLEGQLGIHGNICADPLFCNPENADFTLHCNSPCAAFSPPNPECDLIGAWPVGCGGTPVTQTTWGGIKAMFRE